MAPCGRLAVLTIVAATCTTACVGPSRTTGDYADKVVATVNAVRGSVETARLLAREIADDSMLSNYASVLIGDAEEDARSAEGALSSVQPPTGSDALRDKTLTIVGDAIDAIADVRIAVRRDEPRDVADAAKPLGHLSDELQQLGDEAGQRGT
jgi:hypothetical protein